jgi:nucleoside phosphorylase
VAFLASVAVALSGFASAGAATPQSCTPRLLVVSAVPAEIGPMLRRAAIDHVVEAGGRRFYVGGLEGHRVVMALTGIGLVNADDTLRAAFDRFGCGIRGVVMSGTSGGRTTIGDVTIPARWTLDGGATWYAADSRMLSTAREASASVRLARAAPVGDPACVGLNPDAVRAVGVLSAPRVVAGGDGSSADPFGGRMFPCVPRGGDVFGCRPCADRGVSAAEVARFAARAAPFLDPSFFLGYLEAPPSTPAGFDADDMETAAVARVATEHGVPFIAFRALSDGGGDPLHLPGFPAQFFVYRQLAADNAGAVTVAFLRGWRG